MAPDPGCLIAVGRKRDAGALMGPKLMLLHHRELLWVFSDDEGTLHGQQSPSGQYRTFSLVFLNFGIVKGFEKGEGRLPEVGA